MTELKRSLNIIYNKNDTRTLNKNDTRTLSGGDYGHTGSSPPKNCPHN